MLEVIGTGRFGPVYRAQDDGTGVVVAVKVFDQGLTPEQASAVAAALDQLIEAPLDHASIARPLAAGVEGTRPWMAEPWVAGTLLDGMMSGPRPLADVVLRTTQIAGALDFAAAAGVHHGALHPHDILLRGDETVVSGLGVLQALAEAGLEVPMEGAYVSPQRALGLPISTHDDIYALAAIAFELISGVPVPGNVAKLRDVMPALDGVDRARLVSVFEGSLSRTPEDRPSTALELAAALQYARSAAPVASGDAAPAIEEQAPGLENEREPAAPADTVMPMQPLEASAPAAIDDLPLRAAEDGAADEEPRFREAEPVTDREPLFQAEPELAPERATSPVPAYRAEPPLRDEILPAREPLSGAFASHDEPRSEWRLLPLAATLAIGLLTGFASGFVVGQRDHTPTPRSAERARPRAERSAAGDERPTPTVGQVYTESSIPTQTVTEPPVVAPPEPPQQSQAPVSAPPEQGRRDAAAPPGQSVESRPGTDASTEASGHAARTPAVLDIDSRPRGARVFLDGRLIGTTPLVTSDVVPGPHAVRIDLLGYQRWVAAVNVTPGSRQRVAASLTMNGER